MKKFVNDFCIIRKTILSDQYFVLEVQSPTKLPPIFPGQFVEILVENSSSTFLRRPISVHDVDYENNSICLMIQIVGDGTKQLSLLKVGDSLNMIYPLGNSFSKIENSKILLVGGGCGVAPLLYLAKHLQGHGNVLNILLGARNASFVLQEDQYRKCGNVFISTEDGSMGQKGLVTGNPVMTEHYDRIYTCGPNPMMKAVAKIAQSRNIPCEVSLENMMACGVGACLCCVTETSSGNQCVCTEGPVFLSTELKNWI